MAAAKQCQRLHEMVLNPPMKIDRLLPLVAQSKLSFLAVAEATPLVTALTSSRRETSGLIVVGPEGVGSSRSGMLPPKSKTSSFRACDHVHSLNLFVTFNLLVNSHIFNL